MGAITMHKYHGLGNDYLVIDPNQNQITLQERKIQMLCQRNFGAGADGILYGPLIKNGKIEVLIFNPDGSKAAQSGNGLQIFAKYLRDQKYITEQKVCLTTKAKETEVEFLDSEGSRMRVNMGKADFMTASGSADGFFSKYSVKNVSDNAYQVHEIVNEPLMFHGSLYNTTCLFVGNPNCVIMTEEVSCKKAMELGPYVENAPCFSERMNLQLCKVKEKNRLKIEIYERGAGYTLSSGTGACAAAAAVYRMGLADSLITVEMPGGEIEIEIAADGDIYMTGTVEKVGRFTIEEDFFA